MADQTMAERKRRSEVDGDRPEAKRRPPERPGSGGHWDLRAERGDDVAVSDSTFSGSSAMNSGGDVRQTTNSNNVTFNFRDRSLLVPPPITGEIRSLLNSGPWDSENVVRMNFAPSVALKTHIVNHTSFRGGEDFDVEFPSRTAGAATAAVEAQLWAPPGTVNLAMRVGRTRGDAQVVAVCGEDGKPAAPPIFVDLSGRRHEARDVQDAKLFALDDPALVLPPLEERIVVYAYTDVDALPGPVSETPLTFDPVNPSDWQRALLLHVYNHSALGGGRDFAFDLDDPVLADVQAAVEATLGAAPGRVQLWRCVGRVRVLSGEVFGVSGDGGEEGPPLTFADLRGLRFSELCLQQPPEWRCLDDPRAFLPLPRGRRSVLYAYLAH